MEGLGRLMFQKDFFRGKRVFLTGHTGFKGSWMCELLLLCGAKVTGFALEPPTDPALFYLAGLDQRVDSITGDVRDLSALESAVETAQPEIVIHMAAQPIVRDSYANPVYTYETNVMGTVNVLEAVRRNGRVKSFLNITTDKVYKNNEWEWGYREIDELNGFDPYSNSKSCSELVTDSYKQSFFKGTKTAVSTARAGNVIGGGDFANDRIIPDCVRAAAESKTILVRNPYSTRPYQHVLEPLYAYLTIVQAQYEDQGAAGSYNIGPDDSDCVTTGELATIFCRTWGGIEWKNTCEENAVHEANFLKLDCSKAKTILKIKPRWNIQTAIEKTVEWVKHWQKRGDITECMEKQIMEYLQEDDAAK
nr:CDP-glucose 4,6-dehydratase [Christensenella timonensis]